MHCHTIVSLLASALLSSTLVAVASNVPSIVQDGVDTDADVVVLQQGVERIGRSGVPGPITVFGPDAFAIATGDSGQGVQEALIAAARVDRGRVVAFGHGGFFGQSELARVDTARFIENALRWVAGDDAPRRVATVQTNAVAEMLEARGYTVTRLSANDWIQHLDGVDVLIMDANRYQRDAELATLDRFIRTGGGLLTTSLGWGWMQLNPGRDLATEHPGNRLLAPYGLMWADGYLSATAPENTYRITPPAATTHAATALDLLEQQAAGNASPERALAAQASRIVLSAAQTLPPKDTLLRPRLEALVREHGGQAVPTARAPIGIDRGLDRVLISLEIESWRRTPSEPHPAHPAAEIFPGSVPAEPDANPRTVTVQPATPDWQSTGLYAPPGLRIEVAIPADRTDAGYRVRIGAHSDRNWHHANWQRIPEITIDHPLNAPTTHLSTPFGGLVYIVAPRQRPADRSPFELTIRHVVDAPRFVLGKTDPAEWQRTRRHHPGPWAELETSKLIITLPSAVIRELDDPTHVLEVWDRVMDLCADLATIPHERARPERIVADQQISAGYMHAGYPIMTGLDVRERFIDANALLEGNGVWGFYHEIGHNHQSSDWTFDGTVEVTVNLFTLYVMEHLCGLPMNTGHPALRPDNIHRALEGYFEAGTPFDQWKRDPFLALAMYLQLRTAFGWETFHAVFAEYRDLPQAERPRNDLEKRDQWMVRFSRRVNRNLGPFFEAWGVPTSDAARASIAELDTWMPDNLRRVHPD